MSIFSSQAPLLSAILDDAIITETMAQYKGISAKFNITSFVFVSKVRFIPNNQLIGLL
jgi:hypothetical protein